MKRVDLLGIGGGPAGMAAALAARKSGCHVLLAERADTLGGILNQCVHTGFGLIYFGEELTGQEYAARFVGELGRSDVDVVTGATVVGLTRDGEALISGENGIFKVRANAVILASGCRERPVGALPVAGTRPSGVFTAGTAQKMINLADTISAIHSLSSVPATSA
jgi:NADPH-dependent 2,4-dienoyl-CoA reductase/sulfur reductase-like enzyme